MITINMVSIQYKSFSSSLSMYLGLSRRQSNEGRAKILLPSQPNRIGSISYPAYLSTGVPAWIITLPIDKNIKNSDTNQNHMITTISFPASNIEYTNPGLAPTHRSEIRYSVGSNRLDKRNEQPVTAALDNPRAFSLLDLRC
jgi:hypothetical protein